MVLFAMYGLAFMNDAHMRLAAPALMERLRGPPAAKPEAAEPEHRPARSILLRKREMPMSNDIANREAGPLLEPNERPASLGKR